MGVTDCMTAAVAKKGLTCQNSQLCFTISHSEVTSLEDKSLTVEVQRVQAIYTSLTQAQEMSGK